MPAFEILDSANVGRLAEEVKHLLEGRECLLAIGSGDNCEQATPTQVLICSSCNIDGYPGLRILTLKRLLFTDGSKGQTALQIGPNTLIVKHFDQQRKQVCWRFEVFSN